MWRVLGNISCDFDAKVKGQIMYFLVNASTPKLLDIATSKLCRCICHMMQRILGNFLCNLDPNVKVKDKGGYMRW